MEYLSRLAFRPRDLDSIVADREGIAADIKENNLIGKAQALALFYGQRVNEREHWELKEGDFELTYAASKIESMYIPMVSVSYKGKEVFKASAPLFCPSAKELIVETPELSFKTWYVSKFKGGEWENKISDLVNGKVQ